MSWQKDIGTRFEHQVKDRFNALTKGTDLTAVRIWYSGAGMREPFDVGIYRGEARKENLVLQIEAKRTQGRSLGVQLEWLEKVSDQHVIVFAVGRRNPVSMWVVRSVRKTPVWDFTGEVGLNAKPGSKSVAIHERHVLRESLDRVGLMALGRVFVVETFSTFCERFVKEA